MRQFAIPLLISALAMSACQKSAIENVTEAVVQLPAVAGRPGVAYFTLTGGATANRLMQVSSPQIVKIELHESKMMSPSTDSRQAVMTMAPIEAGVEVPAGGVVKFEPGGKHAMLFDINPKIGPGAKMKLSFTYSNGRMIEVDADVKAAGAAGKHQH